jgi:hypothetical protein
LFRGTAVFLRVGVIASALFLAACGSALAVDSAGVEECARADLATHRSPVYGSRSMNRLRAPAASTLAAICAGGMNGESGLGFER